MESACVKTNGPAIIAEMENISILSGAAALSNTIITEPLSE